MFIQCIELLIHTLDCSKLDQVHSKFVFKMELLFKFSLKIYFT